MRQREVHVAETTSQYALLMTGNHRTGILLASHIDTCGIRTHAGKPHRLSRPTPWPLGQSVNAAMNTEESFGGLHTKEGFGL